MKRRSPDKGFNDHITSSWQVFSSGETLLQISFEIFVYRGLNSQLTALPTPCFSYPKPSVSFLNPLWRAAGCKDCGPSSDQALGYGVEGRTKWSHTSCALSRGGVHRLMCGRGVLSFPGKDGGDTGESGAGGPPCHLFQLLPCHSIHSHPQFSFVLDPSEREAARNWNIRQ